MITLIITLLGLLFSTAGGLIVLVIIIGGLILQNMFKQSDNKPPNIKKEYYRYHLINMETHQIVGAGNDYLEMCRKKRELGDKIMIKDNEYIKKGKFL